VKVLHVIEQIILNKNLTQPEYTERNRTRMREQAQKRERANQEKEGREEGSIFGLNANRQTD